MSALAPRTDGREEEENGIRLKRKLTVPMDEELQKESANTSAGELLPPVKAVALRLCSIQQLPKLC